MQAYDDGPSLIILKQFEMDGHVPDTGSYGAPKGHYLQVLSAL